MTHTEKWYHNDGDHYWGSSVREIKPEILAWRNIILAKEPYDPEYN